MNKRTENKLRFSPANGPIPDFRKNRDANLMTTPRQDNILNQPWKKWNRLTGKQRNVSAY